MANDLDTRVEEWRNNCARRLCSTCSDTCCNGHKHRIDINHPEIGPFVEHGVPIVPLQDLDIESALKNNYLNHRGHILRINEKPLEKPSLVQMSTTSGLNDSGQSIIVSAEYSLYVTRFCPMYENGHCIIYEDPRRPSVCKEYPLFKQPACGGDIFLYAKCCMPFNQRDIRNEFNRLFSAQIIRSSSQGDLVKLS